MLKMTRYGEHVNQRETSQRTEARDDQVKNNAGGFVFAPDKWVRLDRFLVLGAEGGTYYVSERKLVRENAKALAECIAEDGPRVVRRIVEISDAGRAPKNDPAIFSLAMCAGAKDEATRKAALEALPKVCRIGTHLFHFAADVQGFRGWGPALCRAVASWYTSREPKDVAYDLVKYQSRDGWGHRDLIRLSHPKAPTAQHKAALTWSVRGLDNMMKPTKRKGGAGERGYGAGAENLPSIISAFEEMHAPGTTVDRMVALIRENRLPHECVPNEVKDKPAIWEALVEHMGPTALIRNLAKMTNVGLLKPMSDTTAKVCAKLTDSGALFKARVHPMAFLLAMKTYATGQGFRGSLKWEPVSAVLDALDAGFYASFDAIEPTGKRHLLAIDCSGSMTWGSSCIAGTNVTAREGSAAMAMATARSEKRWHVMGFTGGRGSRGLVNIPISPRQRLDDVVSTIERAGSGGTDCSMPMLYALERRIEVDVFSVYTDNETWEGQMHPFQALRQYRERMGVAAKLVVVGMTSSGFTIADPNDAGMLDVVGFDSATPAILADFAADREVRP